MPLTFVGPLLAGLLFLNTAIAAAPPAPATPAIVVLEHPLPRLPEATDQLSGANVTCAVRLEVDRKGKVMDTRVSGCDQRYSDEAKDTAWKWSFEPATTADGQPRAFAWESRFTFEPSTGHTAVEDLGEGKAAAVPVLSSEELRVLTPKAPSYPEDMLQHPERSGLQPGETWCRVRIAVNADGSVAGVESSLCPEALFTYVAPAVQRWRFQPPQVNGQPHEASVVVPVLFRSK